MLNSLPQAAQLAIYELMMAEASAGPTPPPRAGGINPQVLNPYENDGSGQVRDMTNANNDTDQIMAEAEGGGNNGFEYPENLEANGQSAAELLGLTAAPTPATAAATTAATPVVDQNKVVIRRQLLSLVKGVYYKPTILYEQQAKANDTSLRVKQVAQKQTKSRKADKIAEVLAAEAPVDPKLVKIMIDNSVKKAVGKAVPKQQPNKQQQQQQQPKQPKQPKQPTQQSRSAKGSGGAGKQASASSRKKSKTNRQRGANQSNASNAAKAGGSNNDGGQGNSNSRGRSSTNRSRKKSGANKTKRSKSPSASRRN